MPKFHTVRVIFPRPSKTALSEKKSGNQFWQSASLVIIGAIISFLSSLATGIFSSRNENKKIAFEQKVLFEKDFANIVSQNLNGAMEVLMYPEVSIKDKRVLGNLESLNTFLKKEKSARELRSRSAELLMRVYVVDSIIMNLRI